MKAIFKIFSCLCMLLCAVGVNSAMGATLSCAVGGTPAMGALMANGVALVAGHFMPANALHAGVFTEIWTAEMIKAFRTAPECLGWYDRIRSYDQYVENEVIHFTELGGDPKVLINNTTYPLAITKLEDADKPVSLDKFDTEATPVTDDELHAVSYDKMASVQERHREAIKESVRKKAIHAIAPDEHTANKTVVIRTTGEVDTPNLRKRLTPADIVTLKAAFDKMGMPDTDRVLVLCSDHINDLLLTDQKFREAYNINQTEGKIARLYGFDIYEYNGTPYYTSAGKKKTYGAATTGTDRQSSVAFHVSSMMKANGSVQMYYSEAKTDPLYHRNLVNFRKWGICLPLKSDCTRGAIVSTVETA